MLLLLEINYHKLVLKVRLLFHVLLLLLYLISLCANMKSVNCEGYFTAVQCPVICTVLHMGDARVAHFIDSSKNINIINLTN